MGAWSEYPDGNDYNIDLFSYFLNQYFEWCENNDDKVLEYDPKNPSDPGLGIRMQIRMGGSPDFSESDLEDKNMEVFLQLLKNYNKHHDSNEVVGLAISLARVMNNEKFGIGVTDLPEKNLLSDNIKSFIRDNVGIEDEKVLEFFN